MREETVIKVVAIVVLGALVAINLITANTDGVILTTAAGIIGGIAGYGIRRSEGEAQENKG